MAWLRNRASSGGKSTGVSTNQSFNKHTALFPSRRLSALFHAVAHHLTEVIEWLGLPLFLVVPERPAVTGGRTLDLGANLMDRPAAAFGDQRAVGADLAKKRLRVSNSLVPGSIRPRSSKVPNGTRGSVRFCGILKSFMSSGGSALAMRSSATAA